MITLPGLQRVCGVDFSGASKSGKTAWLADFEVDWSKGNLRLAALAPLGRLAGSDERVRVCEYLAEAISSSSNLIIFYHSTYFMFLKIMISLKKNFFKGMIAVLKGLSSSSLVYNP